MIIFTDLPKRCLFRVSKLRGFCEILISFVFFVVFHAHVNSACMQIKVFFSMVISQMFLINVIHFQNFLFICYSNKNVIRPEFWREISWNLYFFYNFQFFCDFNCIFSMDEYMNTYEYISGYIIEIINQKRSITI